MIVACDIIGCEYMNDWLWLRMIQFEGESHDGLAGSFHLISIIIRRNCFDTPTITGSRFKWRFEMWMAMAPSGWKWCRLRRGGTGAAALRSTPPLPPA